VGSIIATIAIAATMVMTPEMMKLWPAGTKEWAVRYAYMAMPVLVVMGGLVASLIGVFSIKILQGMGPQNALRYSTFIGGAILIIVTYIICSSLACPWESSGLW